VSPDLWEKAERVLDEISAYRRVIVALSGGVDNTLMAYLAKLAVGANVIAVTADSPSLPSSDLEEAKDLRNSSGQGA